MRITSVDPIVLRIPFDDGSPRVGLFPTAWTHLDVVLVRIAADNGLVGWGEAFGYSCAPAVAAMVRSACAPLLVGRDPTDPAALNAELQRRTVLPGRHGITTFAISGADIALWDLAAKATGVSLAELLGGRRRSAVPAYASLVRYGDGDLVERYAREACEAGYREIKLHEITMPEICRARAAVGPDVKLTVDVNCGWTHDFTSSVIPELAALDIHWLEEPIFPPEDWQGLARLRGRGVAIAAGENACTVTPFQEAVRAEALDILQPSVTKVGGVTVMRDICSLAAGRTLAPHSPYFGPGYLASLQLAAWCPDIATFEHLAVAPDAWPMLDMPLPRDGAVAIPDRPGLGCDPDPACIDRFSVT
jgi:L-alanine-DL-glutamate epimerase-like enolase superfamily enzyme